MKQFFDKFNNLKGAKFIGINGYTNKYGEVANISLNTNVSIQNAKEKDLKTLQSLSPEELESIATENTLPIDVMKVAQSEMVASAEKNLSAKMDERTNQSKGQADAYLNLCPSVKLHKDSMNVFVSGFFNDKKVIVEGEYPEKNKRVKTKCKDAITKYCDLRMAKYRQYNVGSMDQINITGSTLQFK
jgi:tRNA G10  N-methylase Trm11